MRSLRQPSRQYAGRQLLDNGYLPVAWNFKGICIRLLCLCVPVAGQKRIGKAFMPAFTGCGMIHIGSISSGLSSAVMCDRLLQKHPDALLVFEDVLFEDEDNYRFLADCEKRWNKKIIRLTEGRTPYEISHAHHLIPNN